MTASARPVLFPSMGGEVCDWIETYLCHGPGDVQGEALVLDDEFRALVWRCYEVYPKDHPWAGRRVHRRVFLSRPKGRAKSELAGALCCVEGLGPAQFDGWNRNRPVGRPIRSPWVRAFATEEGQAGNTFDNCFVMLSEGEAANEFPGLDVGLTRINLPGGGSIEAATSAAVSKDGGKDTFDVFDETHLWTTPVLHRLHATVTRDLTKRKIANGWCLETSTMFGRGENSVAEQTYMVATKTQSVSSFLFDHRQAPEVDLDTADDDEIRAALEYVYGAAAGWTNIDGIIADEFRNPTKSEADNRRYWFNQPWKLARKYFDPKLLAVLADPDRKVAAKAPVLLAFDGSRDDCTVLLGWTLEPKPHRFTVGMWSKPVGAPPDWRVDREGVADRVAWAMQQWQVRLMICVPRGWYSEIQGWEKLFGDEKLRPFVQFDTNQPKRMAEACNRFSTGLAEASFSHDADPVVDQHLHNCESKDTSWGPIVVRGPGNEPIDGGVCTIVGFYGLSLVPAEPARRRVRAISLAAAMAAAEERDAAGAHP